MTLGLGSSLNSISFQPNFVEAFLYLGLFVVLKIFKALPINSTASASAVLKTVVSDLESHA
jgi:hypothetical protein